MLRHSPVQNTFLTVTLLTASLAQPLLAGAIKQWQMTNVEQAPVLIVGRIGTVRKEFRVPDGDLPWRSETWAMTAEVAVLGSYSLSEQNVPTSGSNINVRFFAYGPSRAFYLNAQPPPLVNLQSGDVLILPLLSNREPGSKPWMLLGIDGLGLTVHARAELSEGAPTVNTGRGFIIRELASSLSQGTPEETSLAGSYVHDQGENLSLEIVPLLERYIGADERRWAAALVNLMGPYRPNIEELRAGGWRDVNWNPSADHGYSIATAILKKLPDSPGSDRLIIDALFARASFAPESASLLADEYVANQYFSYSLRAALSRNQAGTIYIAWNLIEKGHGSLLPYALKSAQDIAGTPAKANLTHAQMLDRDAAASLLRQ